MIHDDQWLFLYRNKKKNDVNHGKYIGVGGKKTIHETIEQCAIREVKEETDFDLLQIEKRGIVTFHYPHLEDEEITIFTSRNFKGVMHECDEGQLVWVNQNDIMNLPLWEGDRIFLKKLLDQETEQFHISLNYNESDELIKSLEE